MSKLRQQISDIRKNTPKRVQWLLMAVAFIVVIILLTLLVGGDNKTPNAVPVAKIAPELKIDPDMINWADVKVGEKKTQTIKISATAPVKIFDMRWHAEDVGGLTVNQTCTKMGQINATLGCAVFITYAPSSAMATENIPVFIDWHDAEETQKMNKTAKIVLTLGAVAPKNTKGTRTGKIARTRARTRTRAGARTNRARNYSRS